MIFYYLNEYRALKSVRGYRDVYGRWVVDLPENHLLISLFNEETGLFVDRANVNEILKDIEKRIYIAESTFSNFVDFEEYISAGNRNLGGYDQEPLKVFLKYNSTLMRFVLTVENWRGYLKPDEFLFFRYRRGTGTYNINWIGLDGYSTRPTAGNGVDEQADYYIENTNEWVIPYPLDIPLDFEFLDTDIVVLKDGGIQEDVERYQEVISTNAELFDLTKLITSDDFAVAV